MQFRRFVESKSASSTIFDSHCFIHNDHAAVDLLLCDFVQLSLFVLMMVTLMTLVNVDSNSHDVHKSFFHWL